LTFRQRGDEEFKFCDAQLRATSPLLSAVQVMRCIENDDHAFLACVISKFHIVVKFEDIWEGMIYLNVFSKDLLGLLPHREIEFYIDLVLGTTLVHKAPYQMALEELRELKVQLQELIDKGFIHGSVSPWGTPILFMMKKDVTMQMCIDY
jgi:hypothetical protein